MNKDRAMFILNIDKDEYIDLNILNKKYKKACLRHHPDKNKNSIIKFYDVVNAHEYMSNYIKHNKKNISFTETVIYIICNIYFMLKSEKIKLYPSLKMLVNKEVYYLKEQNIYIPSWHEYIYFKDVNVIINIFPILPKNISIDENNNIIFNITDNIDNYYEYFKLFNIVYDKLKKGKNIYKNKGIPIIDNKNIYSYKNISDLIIII